jgi:ABC-2 type transport system ATP-binding protein
MVAIRADDLTKEFGDVTAVDDLDLTVEEGEVFGFLGPNGAGKSTTINMLLGFVTPTDGSATVLGRDVETESMQVRERVGVLPEGFTVYDRLTGREHVGYAADMKGVTADVDGLLDRVGLERDAWDRAAGGYSTGMRQRLALACALTGDPDLLILDEPSSGLDPKGMGEMRDLIRDEAADGTTVFFSSHILSEVEAVCDRIGILVHGRLAATGTLDELRDGVDTRSPLTLAVDHVPESLELASIDGVAEVTTGDEEIHCEMSLPDAKVTVIKRVDEVATIQDVISEEASLESLFATYTDNAGSAAGDGAGAEATDRERASESAAGAESDGANRGGADGDGPDAEPARGAES